MTRRPRRPHWSHTHPGVRAGVECTVGERAADAMRSVMGSWPFVGGFVFLMVAWAAVNTVWLANRAFDPYPYILLNLMLSMVAGLQGAILLIAARRADQVAGEIALHTEVNTDRLVSLLEANTALTRHVDDLASALHKHLLAG